MKNDLKNLKTLLPEVDYQALMAQLPEQSHPRRKLRELRRKGILIRVKKGFYVFDQEFIGKSYAPEIVANLLYGPSYVSLEFALSYYQLIPERVEALTSVTTQKNKSFETPIGVFTYRHLAALLYPLGVSLKSIDDRTFLIATPEKALMDIFTLRFDPAESPNFIDVERALEQDLRIEWDALKKGIDRDALWALESHYRNRRWNKQVIRYLLKHL